MHLFSHKVYELIGIFKRCRENVQAQADWEYYLHPLFNALDACISSWLGIPLGNTETQLLLMCVHQLHAFWDALSSSPSAELFVSAWSWFSKMLQGFQKRGSCLQLSPVVVNLASKLNSLAKSYYTSNKLWKKIRPPGISATFIDSYTEVIALLRSMEIGFIFCIVLINSTKTTHCLLLVFHLLLFLQK